MNYSLINDDCIQAMRNMPDASVDSIVTDPPYELGFMSKKWDASGIANNVTMWREALRVLKPGGHLLAFSGSRTYHRMTCAIEDAGFEVRDQMFWLYGSGFPKSLDVSNAIDKAAGASRIVVGFDARAANRSPAVGTNSYGDFAGQSGHITAPATDAAKQWQGWGTALKPAHEPICVARKPLCGTVAANVLKHGTGAINIDACRVGESGGTAWVPQDDKGDTGQFGGGIKDGGISVIAGLGRFPANVMHDGSPEVLAAFPKARTESPARFFYCPKAARKDRDEGLEAFEPRARQTMGNGIGGQPDQQLANNRNIHPTVKPTELMAYLVRLVTPPGGIVLDPFMGSGSTGKAAMREGMRFVGIDMTPEYFEIATARIAAEHAKHASP